MALATALGGTVINADSMQIYSGLRLLTARPSVEDEAAVPHRLYGVLPPDIAGSVAWWRATALAAMSEAADAGRVPILCGGTGMYFHALQHGLAEIPPASAEARAEARALLAELGAAGLHARLSAQDPRTAARLRPADSQRVARAWEVFRTTGKGLSDWQDGPPPEPVPWRIRAILLDPPREALRSAIATRCDAMLEAGAIDEVSDLLARELDPALPAMRAHGVPELTRYLSGDWTLAEARARICAVTAQYTKRQTTWFRHHALAEPAHRKIILARFPFSTQEYERELAAMHNFTCI